MRQVTISSNVMTHEVVGVRLQHSYKRKEEDHKEIEHEDHCTLKYYGTSRYISFTTIRGGCNLSLLH